MNKEDKAKAKALLDIDVIAEDSDKLSAFEFSVLDVALRKEYPMRVLWNGWKGYRDTRYRCPDCKKPVRNDDHYCHRCGQKLIFPKVNFTPYVKGQAQETIIKWEDEDETD